ncbi:hypothetical protein V1478_006256 [Vespula squamosa]|uniref:Uncharacterized protein n=1 Tax=Vespula squamosa TaxID=30214 RepID=A0ABD2B7D1_VESSQ
MYMYTFIRDLFNSLFILIITLERYQRCPRSFNLAIKVSTSGTIAPACLTGGSSTETISILADVSMPRSFGLIFLIGFFFAFIIFGNVAYRASSIAISSKGFIECLIPSVITPVLSVRSNPPRSMTDDPI